MGVAGFDVLQDRVQSGGRRRVALVAAHDPAALTALDTGYDLGITEAVLIGDSARLDAMLEEAGLSALAGAARVVHEPDEDAAAAKAVAMARAGQVDVLLKGQLRTEQLMRAVLAPDGLRTGRLLSDVLLYEDDVAGYRRLVGVTDGGINVNPGLEEHGEIIRNAVQVLHVLGWDRPRVALLSATEAVTESVPSTVQARQLTEMAASGGLGDCHVFGPLALDNALSEAAARKKGIDSEVAGRVDMMVVPNIEAGNILGKAVKYLGGAACGHVVVGAAVPILIPSRAESEVDKLNSLILGVLVHDW